jgi:hypothetical protein
VTRLWPEALKHIPDMFWRNRRGEDTSSDTSSDSDQFSGHDQPPRPRRKKKPGRHARFIEITTPPPLPANNRLLLQLQPQFAYSYETPPDRPQSAVRPADRACEERGIPFLETTNGRDPPGPFGFVLRGQPNRGNVRCDVK